MNTVAGRRAGHAAAHSATGGRRVRTCLRVSVRAVLITSSWNFCLTLKLLHVTLKNFMINFETLQLCCFWWKFSEVNSSDKLFGSVIGKINLKLKMEYQRHMEPNTLQQPQPQNPQWGYGWGPPAPPAPTQRNKRTHSESEDDAFSEESSKDAQ